MYRESIIDQLREIERQVVEGERQLAECEARLAELKRQKQDIAGTQRELKMLRNNHSQFEQERQRLLFLLHP
ncbi:hypothetical protein SAMN05216337_10517 [Bradyrhizobium brasilense]|uniref:Uncharacterized protein n=2 Tax=Bradyrhizobium brasilense TaxID=1419277 RepID=A0A1G7K220_9BRAD|nr:hypothetical protein SAMN05216337_10517 [Bradyrhizobium brasilense]